MEFLTTLLLLKLQLFMGKDCMEIGAGDFVVTKGDHCHFSSRRSFPLPVTSPDIPIENKECDMQYPEAWRIPRPSRKVAVHPLKTVVQIQKWSLLSEEKGIVIRKEIDPSDIIFTCSVFPRPEDVRCVRLNPYELYESEDCR
jgi:hypothetical protein